MINYEQLQPNFVIDMKFITPEMWEPFLIKSINEEEITIITRKGSTKIIPKNCLSMYTIKLNIAQTMRMMVEGIWKHD